jgi:hypothetical protein
VNLPSNHCPQCGGAIDNDETGKGFCAGCDESVRACQCDDYGYPPCDFVKGEMDERDQVAREMHARGYQ